jgi:hypothetical protein
MESQLGPFYGKVRKMKDQKKCSSVFAIAPGHPVIARPLNEVNGDAAIHASFSSFIL